ncbi:MAG TPA: D-inositol-3-phosphate glycosyltransferase [Mycobacteriales bacterium]|nr:D-inositol-3-phosphate glycosyltransferase [Mycobacteriales bacterium]
MLSVHTSPFEQPGSGDAGGMNVYVVELAQRLAALGVEVDIFTRATAPQLPPVVELTPGVTVRHVVAGPFEGLAKEELPAQLCAFTSAVLRVEAAFEPGHFDLVHSHYWLSGQVGWLASERWGVPLVHSMHTLAKVKNGALAHGARPEPRSREVGEEQVVAAADRLVASTEEEAAALVQLYGGDPARVVTVAPGVDLDVFRPGPVSDDRDRCGVPRDAVLLLFAGRIQPLKAPDVLIRAAAALVAADPGLRRRLVVAVVGGPSGTGRDELDRLRALAAALDIGDAVRFEPPAPQHVLARWYRAADVCVVPSYTESFGLVALEAQASGTPIVAAAVGGLPTAVRDGVSGVLVEGHEPTAYAAAIRRVLAHRPELSAGALPHAQGFAWSVTAARMLEVYAAALHDAEPLPRAVNE